MASMTKISSYFVVFTALGCLLRPADSWSDGGATWFGPRDGAGSDGGACEFKDAVSKPPFNSMVSAGGRSIYQDGSNCGHCYQVKCTSNDACSGSPVTVAITDFCPDAQCSAEDHFDLSGTAFAALAKPGQGDNLLNAGVIKIQFEPIQCPWKALDVSFKLDGGSNTNFTVSLPAPARRLSAGRAKRRADRS